MLSRTLTQLAVWALLVAAKADPASSTSDIPVPEDARAPAVPAPANYSAGVFLESSAESDSALPKSSISPNPIGNNGDAGQPPRKHTASSFFQVPASPKPIRVLGFFPYNGYSHFLMFKILMSELARRGHQVTVVSPFPLKVPEANYTDVDLSDILPPMVDTKTFAERVGNFESSVYARTQVISYFHGAEHCSMVFSHPKVKALLSGDQQFDVVFTEVFGTDCYLAVGYHFKAHIINMVTSHTISWMNDYLGDFNNPSVIPNHFLPGSFKDLSYFGDRIKNVLSQFLSNTFYHFLCTLPSDAVVREALGSDVPSLEELRRSVSLVMINSHPSIFFPKPTVPRVLQIGGIHLQPPDSNKIPQDIKIWLDTAPNGVVLFSFGSLMAPESIPPHLRKAFVSAFQELRPLRILWKYNAANASAKLVGLSDNVKLAAWLPQIEVLNHPNTRAFMTHGGMMGVIEAVYSAVPMIGIPLFADQMININRLHKIGCAVYLNHATLTKEDVVDAIRRAATNSTLRRKAEEVSRQFRDRPMSPLDSAVWWTEFIVRQGGAPHLESVTARMPWWQYVLLDVVAFFLLAFLLILYTLYLAVRALRRHRVRLPKDINSKKDV